MATFAEDLQASLDRIGKGQAWACRRLHGIPARTLYRWLHSEDEPPPYTQGMILELLRSEPGPLAAHPSILPTAIPPKRRRPH